MHGGILETISNWFEHAVSLYERNKVLVSVLNCVYLLLLAIRNLLTFIIIPTYFATILYVYVVNHNKNSATTI